MGKRSLVIEIAFLALVLALFAAIPSRYGFDGRGPDVALKIAIYAILALGLNVVIGYTGLLDLGYVAFMSTGMMITALMMSVAVVPEDQLAKILEKPNGRQYVVDAGAFQIPTGGYSFPKSAKATRPFGFDGSIFVAMAASGIVCALMGVLRGLPTLRLVGDYYAIVTLGFAEILYIVFRSVRWTGGAMSLNFAGAARPQLFGEPLKYNTAAYYYMVVAALVLATFALVAIRESRLGRALSAIRLDPIAAQTCGVPVGWYKLVAFAISGFIGGVGGSLFAVGNGNYSATAVNFWESILLVAILVLGGLGSVRGALIGAIVMVGMNELLREELPVPTWLLVTSQAWGTNQLWLLLSHTALVALTMRLLGGVRGALVAILVIVATHFVLHGYLPEMYSTWRPEQQARFLFYGVVLVAMMRFRPEGIWPQRPGERPWGADEQARARGTHAALFNLARPARP